MKKSSTYRISSVILSILACFFISMQAHQVHAATLISENWDTGTPPDNWPNCTGTSTTFNGWYPRGWSDGCGAGAGLVTNIYHSAPRSFHNLRPAGSSWDKTSIVHDLPTHPGKIYVRFYLYLPSSGWSNFDDGPGSAGDEVVHFLFTNSASSNTAFRINLYDNASDTWSPAPECYGQGGVKYMTFALERNGGGGRGTEGAYPAGCYNMMSHFNEWHSYEWMIDATNNKVSYWIDGNPMYTNISAPVNDGGYTTINKLILSLFDSYAKNWQADCYIDDFVVSDTYIGPMPGTGTTPSPPSPPVLR